MGIIFSFSQQPGKVLPGPPPLTYVLERKSAHVFEYAVLLALAVWYCKVLFPQERAWRRLLVSVTFALAYGATDELHQFFISNRGAHLVDVAVDGLGILLMGSALSVFARLNYRRSSPTPFLKQ